MRTIDMFSGFGGATTGAAMAGADVVRSYEVDEVAAAWHEANHPGVCRVADVTRIDWAAEAREVGPIDLLMASPPCPGHSAGGRAWRQQSPEVAARHAQLNTAAFAVVDAVAAFRPRVFLLENVPQWSAWDRWDEYVGRLAALGYEVKTLRHSCMEWGAPTSRPRLLVVGVRGVGGADALLARIEARKVAAVRSFRECIDQDCAAWSPLDDSQRSRPLAARTRAVVDAGLAKFPGYFLLPYYSQGSGLVPQSVDKPIPTITRKARWAIVHPSKGIRMLTARESMTAMGFPPSYKLPQWRGKDNTSATLRMAGNAVPPVTQAAFVAAAMEV